MEVFTDLAESTQVKLLTLKGVVEYVLVDVPDPVSFKL